VNAKGGRLAVYVMRLQPDWDDGLGNEDEPLLPLTLRSRRRSPWSRSTRGVVPLPVEVPTALSFPKALNFVVMAAGRSSTRETGFRTLSTLLALLAPLAGVLSNPSEFGLFHGPQSQCRRGRYFVRESI